MSTAERYRVIVMSALKECSYGRKGIMHRWVSVGQVAMRAGVSRNTVKKHLEAGIDDGDVKGIQTGLGVCYRPSVKNEVAQ